MSTTPKKYVSLEKLGFYDEKIKAFIASADTSALKDAKDYADGLAKNYDAAGSAATVQGNLDKEIERAQKAEEANAAAAKAAQDDVDALETLVGTLPADATATTVVGYIDAKTADIASGTEFSELKGRVEQAEKDIDAIEADYLKAADKTELSNAIAAEKQRAEGIEGGLETRLKAVEDDYLKAADKEALQGDIDALEAAIGEVEEGTTIVEMIEANAKAIEDHQEALDETVATLVGEDTGKSVREIANEELAAQLIGEGAKESLDTLEEIAAWIQSHPDDASAMNKAIEDLKKLVGTIPEDAEAATIVAYIEEVVAAEKERAEGIEEDFEERIAGLETAVGEGGSVDTQIAAKIAELDADVKSAEVEAGKGIQVQVVEVDGKITNVAVTGNFDESYDVKGAAATAKSEAITAAATDATTKADKALADAKTYADGLNTAMDTRVKELETANHTHDNKELLDTYTQTEANLADAVAKKHAHANATVLDGITAEKVAAWDAAEGNAKTYADGLNTAMNTRVEALESFKENLVECSEAEINALFTTTA